MPYIPHGAFKSTVASRDAAGDGIHVTTDLVDNELPLSHELSCLDRDC